MNGWVWVGGFGWVGGWVGGRAFLPTSQMGWCLWERAGRVQGLLKGCLRSLPLALRAPWAKACDCFVCFGVWVGGGLGCASG